MAIRVGDIGIRAASALVLAPAAVLATWAGGFWFLGIMLAACLLLAMEWAKMSAPGDWKAVASAVVLALFAAVLAVSAGELSVGLVLLVFGAAAAGLFARSRRGEGVDAAYGVLYLGWPAILFVWLRDGTGEVGLNWTIMVLAIAWASDIVAYLVGSAVGGPKLWPRFSPNKTWSGFIGGIAAGAITGAGIASWLEMGRMNVLWGAALGLVAALATMGGDLWESALKRRFGVKDAGAIIPGHGGLLDRVDGLMFAIVVVAACRVLEMTLGRGL